MNRKKLIVIVSLLSTAIFILLVKAYISRNTSNNQPFKDIVNSISSNEPSAEKNIKDKNHKQPRVEKKGLPDLSTIPKSLAGTEVDGEFHVDAKGNLIIDHEIRQIFDYFLSAEGQESSEILAARIEAHIDAKLKPPASDQARKLLRSYIEYLGAIAGSIENGEEQKDTLDSIRNTLDQRMAARRKYLPEEAVKAFFEAEEAEDNFNLKIMALNSNESISPQDRENRIIEMEASLPENIRKQRTQERIERNTETQIRELQSTGEDNSDRIFQLRESVYGMEAAQRMTERDTKKSEWRQRVQAYNQEKAKIMNISGISESQKTEDLIKIRNSMFTELEIRRMEAQERAAASIEGKESNHIIK